MAWAQAAPSPDFMADCPCCEDNTPTYPWTSPEAGVYVFTPGNVATGNSLFQPVTPGGAFVPSHLATTSDPFFSAIDGVITVPDA